MRPLRAFGKPKPRRRDPRYGTARWQKVRVAVLRRDGYRCRIVDDCPRMADVCDHVQPVTLATPDREFFDPSGLRAACAPHNLARALLPELGEPKPKPRIIVASPDPDFHPLTGDYSVHTDSGLYGDFTRKRGPEEKQP